MRDLLAFCGVMLWLLTAPIAGQGQSSAAPQQSVPVITSQLPASAVVGRSFSFPLVANGGSPPYLWHLADGHLPPGLMLHAHSGVISGVPTTAGEYRFTVSVADSNAPPLQAQRAMVITVIAGLTIDWKQYPSVQGANISGSVVVNNQSGQDLDLTVIIVAVNSIGRATTLGYQHLPLGAGQPELVVPFGSTPGLGTYVVHADAVAHHPGSGYIYRVRKQTSQPLSVVQH